MRINNRLKKEFFEFILICIKEMSNESSPVSSDFYKVVRGQVEFLKNGINQRVVWLIIAESFFFSGYSILITGNPNLEIMKNQQALLMIIFPYASLLTVVISYVDIIGSLLYLRTLRKKYDKEQEIGDQLMPPITGWHTYYVLEHASSILLPIVFTIIWIYILIAKN